MYEGLGNEKQKDRYFKVQLSSENAKKVILAGAIQFPIAETI